MSAVNPPSKAEKEKSVKIEEKVEEPPQEEGWMEVGKKNKTVVTRTVSLRALRTTLIWDIHLVVDVNTNPKYAIVGQVDRVPNHEDIRWQV